jgi:hypothetical protein
VDIGRLRVRGYSARPASAVPIKSVTDAIPAAREPDFARLDIALAEPALYELTEIKCLSVEMQTMDSNPSPARSMLEAALEQLQCAIALLDRAGAPGQIAAHVDLAANQLADIIQPAGREIMRLQDEDGNPATGSTVWQQRPS